MMVTHPPTKVTGCPETFEAEVATKESLSSFDSPIPDASGQGPTWAEHLTLLGVALTKRQWDALVELPAPLARNPEWTPTYDRITLGLDGKPIDANDPIAVAAATVEHQVAVCPNCGTPVKVG